MPQVYGYLREDQATHGERLVLKTLCQSLPKDFYLYVECPLHDGDLERMPDFITLTTYGVIVLEVKDWVEIVEADKFHVKVRTRQGKVRKCRNPVRKARRFAEILAGKLEGVPQLLREHTKLKVPWGYAVVLPNLPPAVITQLRKPWGNAHVLGIVDLKSPVVTKRLKNTLPRTYNLRRDDIRFVKGVINPPIIIGGSDDKPAIVLDEDQERIVTEAPRLSPVSEDAASPVVAEQQALFTLHEPAEQETSAKAAREKAPPALDEVTRNFSIRLVRGVAGSGKTLVLIQRARYLAAKHPEWRIGVFAFNTKLARNLRASLKGIRNLKVVNFHSHCSSLLKGYVTWSEPSSPDGWVKNRQDDWPIVQEMSPEFVSSEITWIKETGVTSREDYLQAERKGRGHGLRRGGRQRAAIHQVFEAYTKWLKRQKAFDWADVPFMVLKGIEQDRIQFKPFDAILIDEAQDFAPSWIQVVRQLLNPDSGLIFLVDDPSQSIYRYYSWQEKGIPVVGRTRWLRIPYRNTRQIYEAAFEVIRDDQILKGDLEEMLGATLKPELGSKHLRDGPSPQLRRFDSEDGEMGFIRSEIEWLLQNGMASSQIVVLHRRKHGVDMLKKKLRGLDVEVTTFHAPKGLEYEAVFLSQMQLTFPKGVEASEYALSEERRLVYMAMTRARQCLYLSYSGAWPTQLEGICRHLEQVLT